MPRTPAALTDAALDVLRAAVASETTVTLPPVVLDRKVYKEVADALARTGGRGFWSKKAKAFVFPADPRADLAAMLDSGRPPAVQLAAERDKDLSFFRTPAELAARLAHELVDLPPRARVLEPSAGDGAILGAVLDARQDLTTVAVEVDEGRHARLVERFGGRLGVTLERGRFQDWARGEFDDYHAVLMNPPFTEPDDRLAWAAHLELAWSLVRPGGVLWAIVPASLEYHRRCDAARELVRAHGGWSELPADTFKASRTEVRSLLVSMSRPDPDTTMDPC